MNLVIEDEAGTRSVVPFAADAIVVGRGEDVTFRLAERNVSRRHARFVLQGGSVFVEDLGSLTGTRVNGEKIAGRRRLRDGDLVQIGDYDLAVLAEGQSVATVVPPPLPPGHARGAEMTKTDPNAATVRLPALEPTPPSPTEAPPPPAPVQAPSRAARIAIYVALVALGAGLAAGWATGALTR
jgi:pSer/pThr/pTyr-binding forkhead associated (FHA) protein